MRRFFAFEFMVIAEVARSTWQAIKTHVLLEVLVTTGSVATGYALGGGVVGAVSGGIAGILIIVIYVWFRESFLYPYHIYLRHRELEQERQPSICIKRVDAPIVPMANIRGTQFRNSKHVQIRVKNSGVRSVRCRATLVQVERLNQTSQKWINGPDLAVPLDWAMQESTEVRLDQGVAETINVVWSRQKDGQFRFYDGAPARHNQFVAHPGLYRLTVSVSSEDLPTRSVAIEVDNSQGWEHLTVNEAPNGQGITENIEPERS